MKKLLILITLFSIYTPAFCIKNYNHGDQLYIWAVSGLNMRSQANAKAEKILNIPYSKKVKIVDNDLFRHKFNYTMVKSNVNDNPVQWVVDGYWVEVEYEGQRGYVFDAYLGRYSTIPSEPREQPYSILALINDYGEAHWGGRYEEEKTTKLNFEANRIDPDKGHFSLYKLTYDNGCYYETVEESFSGYTQIFLKDVSLEEAYLFFNALTSFEHNKKNRSEGKPETYLFSQKKGKLIFQVDEVNSVSIKELEGGVSILFEGGC